MNIILSRMDVVDSIYPLSFQTILGSPKIIESLKP